MSRDSIRARLAIPAGRWASADAAVATHARADIAALLAVADAAAALLVRWDDQTYSDSADLVGHCWEALGVLRDKVVALEAAP